MKFSGVSKSHSHMTRMMKSAILSIFKGLTNCKGHVQNISDTFFPNYENLSAISRKVLSFIIFTTKSEKQKKNKIKKLTSELIVGWSKLFCQSLEIILCKNNVFQRMMSTKDTIYFQKKIRIIRLVKI